MVLFPFIPIFWSGQAAKLPLFCRLSTGGWDAPEKIFLYFEHYFPNMLFFQEQALGITDFFQFKGASHNGFYRILFNKLDQILEHFWFKDGASDLSGLVTAQTFAPRTLAS